MKSWEVAFLLTEYCALSRQDNIVTLVKKRLYVKIFKLPL